MTLTSTGLKKPGQTRAVVAFVFSGAIVMIGCSRKSSIGDRAEIIGRIKAGERDSSVGWEIIYVIRKTQSTVVMASRSLRAKRPGTTSAEPSPRWKEGCENSKRYDQRAGSLVHRILKTDEQRAILERLRKSGEMESVGYFAILRMRLPTRFHEINSELSIGVRRFDGREVWMMIKDDLGDTYLLFKVYPDRHKIEMDVPQLNFSSIEADTRDDMNRFVRNLIIETPELLVAVPDLSRCFEPAVVAAQ